MLYFLLLLPYEAGNQQKYFWFMCLFVSRILSNIHITVEKMLMPVGCQTSKVVFFPSLYRDAVIRMHT